MGSEISLTKKVVIPNRVGRLLERGARALAIQQPWAWAIVHGFKDIENRSAAQESLFRNLIGGVILVHASKGLSKADYERRSDFMKELGVACPDLEDLELGGIIGSVRVADVVTKSSSRWFRGPIGLVLAKPKRCRFIPAKGQLGLFDPRRSWAPTRS